MQDGSGDSKILLSSPFSANWRLLVHGQFVAVSCCGPTSTVVLAKVLGLGTMPTILSVW